MDASISARSAGSAKFICNRKKPVTRITFPNTADSPAAVSASAFQRTLSTFSQT